MQDLFCPSFASLSYLLHFFLMAAQYTLFSNTSTARFAISSHDLLHSLQPAFDDLRGQTHSPSYLAILLSKEGVIDLDSGIMA